MSSAKNVFLVQLELLALELSGKVRRQRKVKIIVFGEDDFPVRVLHEHDGGKYPTSGSLQSLSFAIRYLQ